jgi:hypothetical protein
MLRPDDKGLPSNMALQRTRGLAAAQFLRFAGRRLPAQGVSGGRSPLNAVPLDGSGAAGRWGACRGH